MKKKINCPHNHLEIITTEYYELPESYDKFMQREEIDMEDYGVGSISTKTICYECDEVLED